MPWAWRCSPECSGVTFFGLVLTPVFYVVLQGLVERRTRRGPAVRAPAGSRRGVETCVSRHCFPRWFWPVRAAPLRRAIEPSRCPAAGRLSGRPGIPSIAVAAAPARTVPWCRNWPDLGDTTLTRLINQLAARQPRCPGGRGAGTRCAGSADGSEAGLRSDGDICRELHPAAPVGGANSPSQSALSAFPDQNIWDGGFDASWELDLFGRVRHNVQAQGALVAANQEDLRYVQVSLTAELARAYFDLRGAQEQLAVAVRNAENQRRTFGLTRERLEAGRGTAFDTERAQAQLSTTLASIPDLESRVREAQYQIGVLVGRSPAAVAAELEKPVAPAGLP